MVVRSKPLCVRVASVCVCVCMCMACVHGLCVCVCVCVQCVCVLGVCGGPSDRWDVKPGSVECYQARIKRRVNETGDNPV